MPSKKSPTSSQSARPVHAKSQSVVVSGPPYVNRLLASLSSDDLALLTPNLRPDILDVRKVIEHRDARIDRLYFVEHGIISVVAIAGKVEVEVGLVGCEGVTGIAVIHGDDRSPHSTYVQVAGSGFSISSDAFRKAIRQSETLHRVFLKYAQAFMIQTSHTAVANARARVEERLARWILMAHDRVPAKDVPLTHEFLALMLGTRRPGVTTAIHELSRRALIQNTKTGVVTIIDRVGLEKAAGHYYGVPEREYKRLMR